MNSHELLPLLPFLNPNTAVRSNVLELAGLAEGEGGPRTFLLRGRELAAVKTAAQGGEAVLVAGLEKLRELATAASKMPPPSVTHKSVVLPVATPHDYCSAAKYYWPRSDGKAGYVRRDGEVNPEIHDESRYDVDRLERLTNALFHLSLAYYLLDEPQFGARAAKLLRVWFVDRKTRQSPHFKFAQGVPGKSTGRPEGLIEARRYLYILDAEALLADCPSWTDRDRKVFRAWISEFFAWLRTSSQGKAVAKKNNNIALWHDVQCAIFAVFLEERTIASSIVKQSVLTRLPQQVDPDGAQSGEMRRARPYDYVAFNLLSMMGLARAGEAVGFDAWWAETEDGRTFERALTWLLDIVGLPERNGQFDAAGKLIEAMSRNAELEMALADAEESIKKNVRLLDFSNRRVSEAETWAEELAKSNDTLARRVKDAQRRSDLEADAARTAQEEAILLRERVRAAEQNLSALNVDLEKARNEAKHHVDQAEVARRTLATRTSEWAEVSAQARVHAREVRVARAQATAALQALELARTEAATMHHSMEDANSVLAVRVAELTAASARAEAAKEEVTRLGEEMQSLRHDLNAQAVDRGNLEKLLRDAHAKEEATFAARLKAARQEAKSAVEALTKERQQMSDALSNSKLLASELELANEREHKSSVECDQLREELARLEKANLELTSKLTAEAARVTELRSSTSWRVTAPLRNAARLFRGDHAELNSHATLGAIPNIQLAIGKAVEGGVAIASSTNGSATNQAKVNSVANSVSPVKLNGETTAAKRVPAPLADRAGCLSDYVRSLRGSIDALEKTALRHRSLPARDLLARIATAGLYSYDHLEATLESEGTLTSRFGEIGMEKIHRGALGSLARVVGNQGVTPHDELRAIWLYQSFIAMFGSGKLRPIDHILYIDLLTREGRREEARVALESSGLRDADAMEHACLEANILHPGATVSAGDANTWLAALNRLFVPSGLEQLSLIDGQVPLMARLACKASTDRQAGPLISVLMTTFNPDKTVDMAIRSVLAQTWRNLELLVVDDCSSDTAFALVKAWEARDARVRVIRAEQNGGTYAAKNRALAIAEGEFVTCHDSDDWSHPRKLERQAEALLTNKGTAGNLSSWIRATPMMELQRFSATGKMIYPNTSSLMFRRAPVIERCGFYDNVRTGADSEFYRRIERVFGHNLPVFETPLSFGQVREGALTHQTLGNGYESATRVAYRTAWRTWHQNVRKTPASLRVGLNEGTRSFPAPANILAVRAVEKRERVYDVIIASDFRMAGGNTHSCIEEIKAHRRAGLTTAICQMSSFRRGIVGKEAIDWRIVELVADGFADQVDLEDDVRCRLLLLRYPPILQFTAGLRSGIKADQVRVVVNQPPAELDGSDRRYDIGAVARNAVDLFHKQPIWMPIGALARTSIAGSLARAHLAPQDWHNVIDVDEWRAERASFVASKPVIGRHSRDDFSKWPEDRATLEAVYPTDGSVDVRVLGGARSVQKLLGAEEIANWKVFAFDSVMPHEFLKTIDYFVYFHHTQRVEAFGRTIIEAIASGCVAILPRHFEEVFKEGALYCEPHEVQGLVHALYADRARHMAQVQRGEAFVRANFGYEVHEKRVREIIES